MSSDKKFCLLTILIFGTGLIWLGALHGSNARKFARASIISALVHLSKQPSVKTNLTESDEGVYDPAAIRNLDWSRFFPSVIDSSEVFVTNEIIPVNSHRIVCAAKYGRQVLALRGDGQVIELTQEALTTEINAGRLTALDKAIGRPAW